MFDNVLKGKPNFIDIFLNATKNAADDYSAMTHFLQGEYKQTLDLLYCECRCSFMKEIWSPLLPIISKNGLSCLIVPLEFAVQSLACYTALPPRTG